MRLLLSLLFAFPVVSLRAAPSTAELAEFFLPPELDRARLSPDGDHMGFLARRGDAYSIGLCELATGSMNLSKGDAKIRPLDFWWKSARRVLIKTSNEKLNALGFTTFDLEKRTTEDTWQLIRQPGLILDAQPHDARHVIMFNSREINRVDLQNGDSDTIDRFPTPVRSTVVDAEGHARAAFFSDYKFGTFDLWWRAGPTGEWRHRHFTAEERRFIPQGLDADGVHFWGWEKAPGKAAAFSRFHTPTGEFTARQFLQDYPPSHLLKLGRTRQPIAVAYAQGASVRLFALAPENQAAVDRLQKQFAGFFPVIVDALADGKTWLVWIGNSRLPGAYFIFNHQTGETSLIAQTHSRNLSEDRLAPAQYFTFSGRDGQTLAARLWRPINSSKPAPLIVYCPQYLPSPPVLDLYSSEIQAFVAQGFAVLQVNVRGTTGFTTTAPASADWSTVVQEDLEDAVKFLTSQKVTDANRVYLFGTDFGGVLALEIATRPSPFAAVATINVPAKVWRDDLLMYTDDTGVNGMTSRLGGWAESGRVARQLSPLQNIPQVRIPALYLHDEDSIKGRPDDDGRQIRSSLAKDAKAETGLAYSWTDRLRPPSKLAEENARIYLRIGNFFSGRPAK